MKKKDKRVGAFGLRSIQGNKEGRRMEEKERGGKERRRGKEKRKRGKRKRKNKRNRNNSSSDSEKRRKKKIACSGGSRYTLSIPPFPFFLFFFPERI